MPRRPVQIVWLKRDLRVADHAPLAEAAGRGPVLPLFVVEPGYWCEPDASGRQFAFLAESLVELRAALAALGQPLVVRVGEAVDVLEDLRPCLPVGALWSHEETGNGWTYARDREVHAWARAHGVPWHERRQTGVIRRLGSHDGWADRWDRFMRRPIVQVPLRLLPVPAIEPGPIPSADALGLPADSCPQRQPGGRAAGREALRSFLAERGRPYQRAMSSPTVGALHCSRLSPHLTWGTVSVREALQAAEARLAGLAPDERHPWQGALGSFIGRLHWHCHFVQKLETEPAIEHRSLHPAYDGLRGNDETRLAAWSEGRTGWPFVDACMRMLHATGWLNFRMRAMVMSVAAHQLWLDWRSAGLPLARLFTDYEPGIHWPQCQMQSGATGINTIRIYNPVKQGHDHDPDGAFIRRWCPELARVPTRWIHTPWTMPALEQAEAGCRIGRDYPAPIIDQSPRRGPRATRSGRCAGAMASPAPRTRSRPATAAAGAACRSPMSCARRPAIAPTRNWSWASEVARMRRNADLQGRPAPSVDALRLAQAHMSRAVHRHRSLSEWSVRLVCDCWPCGSSG